MLSYFLSLIIFAAAMCLIYYDFRALIMHNRATRSISERAAVYLTIMLGCAGIIVCIVALGSLVLTALQKHYFGAGLLILGGIYLGCGIIGGIFTRYIIKLLRANEAEKLSLTSDELRTVLATTDLGFLRIWLRIISGTCLFTAVFTGWLGVYPATLALIASACAVMYLTWRLRRLNKN